MNTTVTVWVNDMGGSFRLEVKLGLNAHEKSPEEFSRGLNRGEVLGGLCHGVGGFGMGCELVMRLSLRLLPYENATMSTIVQHASVKSETTIDGALVK